MLPKQSPFTTLSTHLCLFIVVVYFFVLSFQQVCDHRDQSALLAFSAKISTPRLLSLNWSSSISCCHWEGVECDINGSVMGLQLSSRGLEGVITPLINNLVTLTHLNLSNNRLHGSLGEEMTHLINIRILDLSSNSIFGSIPRDIGKLLFLEKLHLNYNNLNGSIPQSLMNCTHIIEIILRDNKLNGDISKLDFSKLTQLQKIDFRNNSLNGTLSESIYSCKSLVAFRISENNITGQISSKILQLKSLSFLSIGGNSFTNITMMLQVLAKCKNLTLLSISSNFYGESLPVKEDFIGIDEYLKLQFFFLYNCGFEEGPIPNWLSRLKNLCVLSLSNNRLKGRVPSWLGTLPNLFTLDLRRNNLDGELPLQFWQFPALVSQTVQIDLLSEFELPVSLPRNNMQYIRLKAYYYRTLYLSHNAFCGNIPREVGNLQNLHHLMLSDNHFSGHIPSSISNLKNLESLALSQNKLTGKIPSSLTSLNFLSYFNVSYNDLEGPIPINGQFDSFGESNYIGNPHLCGKPVNHPCHQPILSQAIDQYEIRDHKLQKFLNGLYVGFATGFSSILTIASYVWFKHYKIRQTS